MSTTGIRDAKGEEARCTFCGHTEWRFILDNRVIEDDRRVREGNLLEREARREQSQTNPADRRLG